MIRQTDSISRIVVLGQPAKDVIRVQSPAETAIFSDKQDLGSMQSYKNGYQTSFRTLKELPIKERRRRREQATLPYKLLSRKCEVFTLHSLRAVSAVGLRLLIL